MRTLQQMERMAWDMATGIDHPHYRQAIWRPSRQDPETVALGQQRFSGDRHARGGLVMPWQRKAWGKAGIVAVNANVWSDFADAHAGHTPAVLFTNPNGSLGVGRLRTYDDIGVIEPSGGEALVGHGMRLGPNDVQFGLGAVSAKGEIFTPDSNAYETAGLGPIPVAIIGQEGTAWEHMNFS